MAQAVQVESLWSGLTDNSGQPLAAGKVYTYYAGTSTPVSLFTDSNKQSAATNPLILDGYGRAQVWADGRYKFVVKTSADVALFTLDNILYGFDDSQLVWGGTASGTGDVATITAPSVTQYDDGQRLCFIAYATNTGAVTVNVNGLGAVSVVKGPSASPLVAGDILAGSVVNLTYQVVGGVGRYRLDAYPTVADIQSQRLLLAENISGTNSITGTLTPSPTQYVTGQVVKFKALNANTGPVTVNISGLGAKAVQRYGAALVGGEIKADDMVELIYDGTQFQLMNAIPAPLFVDRANGSVGIGTTAPKQGLEVRGQITSSSQIAAGIVNLELAQYSADSSGTQLQTLKSRGTTINANGAVLPGDSVCLMNFYGNTGSGYARAGYIQAVVDSGNVSSSSMPGAMIIGTTANGSTSSVERVQIDSFGNIGLGAKSRHSSVKLDVRGRLFVGSGMGDAELGFNCPAIANQTAWQLATRFDVGGANDDIKFMRYNNSSFVDIPFQISSLYGNSAFGSNNVPSAGVRVHIKSESSDGNTYPLMCANSSNSILFAMLSDGAMFTGTSGSSPYNLITNAAANMYVASTGLLYRSTSSLKYKRDVTDAPHGLADVLKLRSVLYKGINDGDTVFGGLIAEEVHAAGLREFVQYADDGSPDALAYGNMVALAFKAIQELNLHVQQLKTKVATLEGA
jgi:hypothetical protein